MVTFAFRALVLVQVAVIIIGFWGLAGGEPGTFRGDNGESIAAGAALLSLLILGPAITWLFNRLGLPDDE